MITLIRSGDHEAFDKLYQDYWELVFDSAFKRVNDEGVAKEITQELFIHIWEKRESLIINTSLEAYLVGATKYRVLNYFRASIVQEKYHQDLIFLVDDFAEKGSDSALNVQDIKKELEKVLEQMPKKTKQIFLMSRFEHKPTKEIAHDLNLSAQTVKNQLSSALKIIRENFSFSLFLALLMIS